jgi:hypothetical protein
VESTNHIRLEIYSMHGVEVTHFYAITILKRFARAASGPVICIEI